jgi:hypothetical protein
MSFFSIPSRPLLRLVIDWAVYRLAGEAHSRSAVLLYGSSYVTWTFQTHTFSNSIEAVLVSCSLVTILAFKHAEVLSLHPNHLLTPRKMYLGQHFH